MLDKGYVKIGNCPNCNGKELVYYGSVFSSPYFDALYEDIPIAVATLSNFVRCDDCGLYIQAPRLDEENLVKFYVSGIYTMTLGMSEDVISKDEMRRAKELIVFMDDNNIKPKTHLDIGAARGHFLGLTKEKYGSKVYGTDYYGKYNGMPLRHAELISSIHLLEHCPDPKEELRKYRKYCNKYLLLEVPAATENAFRFAHLFVFPKETIVDMIKSAGFNILNIEEKSFTRILAEVA